MISRSTDIRSALRSRQRGFLLNPFRFGGGGGSLDPYWSSVAALLHMNGTNASTTFTDSSSNAYTFTPNGNAQISTAQSMFGGASGLFDGTGDFLTQSTAASWHLAGGDFTIEAWVRPTLDLTRQRMIAATRADNPGTNGWELGVNATNKLFFFSYLNNATPYVLTSTGNVTVNTWSHVAVARVGTAARLFINGVVDGSGTSSSSIGQGSGIYIGRWAGNTARDWQGYLDDLRITIGAGRYTANFTPPAAQFPDS